VKPEAADIRLPTVVNDGRLRSMDPWFQPRFV